MTYRVDQAHARELAEIRRELAELRARNRALALELEAIAGELRAAYDSLEAIARRHFPGLALERNDAAEGEPAEPSATSPRARNLPGPACQKSLPAPRHSHNR
jgi:hypothetical protein